MPVHPHPPPSPVPSPSPAPATASASPKSATLCLFCEFSCVISLTFSIRICPFNKILSVCTLLLTVYTMWYSSLWRGFFLLYWNVMPVDQRLPAAPVPGTLKTSLVAGFTPRQTDPFIVAQTAEVCRLIVVQASSLRTKPPQGGFLLDLAPWLRDGCLSVCPGGFPRHVCVLISFYKDTSYIRLGAILIITFSSLNTVTFWDPGGLHST